MTMVTPPMLTTMTEVVDVDVPPVVSGGPANTVTESAHSIVSASRVLFMGNAPIEVVTYSTGFAGRTPHSTPADPAANALLRTYLTGNRLSLATELCAERLLLSETLIERACWTKDWAVVLMASGRFREAADRLRPVRTLAPRFDGPYRARVECVIARSHEHLDDYDPAFEHYTAAHFYAEADPFLAAQIDTNTGRCYIHAGRPESSHEYFDRAHSIALQSSDILLQAEIDESRALAFEAQGDYRQALVCAAQSYLLLAPTDFKLAREETKITRDRIERKLS